MFSLNALHLSDSSKKRRISILPVPAFGYTPETRGYAGVVTLFSGKLAADSNTRASNAKVQVNYTQRRQLIAELGWNLYLPQEKHFTSASVQLSSFPDYLWGHIYEYQKYNEYRLTYSSRRFVADLNWLFRVSGRKKMYVGPAFRYFNYSNFEFLDGEKRLLPPPGYRLQFITVAGSTFLLDRRNNLLLPEKGNYLLLTTQVMRIKQPFKSFYPRAILDGRIYFSGGKTALALRSKSVYSDGGTFDGAIFGGDETARGYYLGRYRTRFYSTLQYEFRYMFLKRWGLAAFGGLSYLDIHTFGFQKFIPNAGGGIRFRIDRKENINLRLDYGVGAHGNSGFYVAFGESF